MSTPRWWGWGVQEKTFPAHKTAALRGALGFPEQPPDWPPDLPAVRKPLLPEATLDALGPATDDADRLRHACGKSYRDLLRLRRGWVEHVPDRVLYPASSQEVAHILEIAGRHGIAVVPFGGGTSVVGGVEGPADRPFVTLDLTRLNKLVRLERLSGLATFEAGVLGPELERVLNAEGLTLGHFPQSFEFSTLGGWVATRSAGQNSTRNGKIEDMVSGLKVELPGGQLASREMPARAAGPDLKQFLIGSEGTLGVITEVTVRLKPRPPATLWKSFYLPSFDHAVHELRRIVQAGVFPSIARLSDPEETRFLLAAEDKHGLKGLALKALEKRGGCLALLGFEGEPAEVKRDAQHARKELQGLDLGSGPGESWARTRFELPYLRDDLLTARLLVETLETATNWANLPYLYRRVREDLHRALGPQSYVLSHLSHLYPDGASLYVTFMAPQELGSELEQWTRAKRAATDAIMAAGGTLSHHHGVGLDHAPWLEQEHGAAGLRILRAVKRELDPQGILNPGKLLL